MEDRTINYAQLVEKWKPVLEDESFGKIDDPYRKRVTAVLLENNMQAIDQEQATLASQNFLTEADGANAPTNQTGANINNWDPILISLVRRAMPNLIAFDILGVQPMTGPTGLIFAMKARYADGSPRSMSTSSTEGLFNEADTDFSGHETPVHAGDPSSLPTTDLSYVTSSSPDVWTSSDDGASPSVFDSISNTFGVGQATTTAIGEGFTDAVPDNHNDYLEEMGFTIERATVTARTRALRAEYSMEMAQDLRAIHGLDAESELANILTSEILAEINREVIRTLNWKAKIGCQQTGLAATANSGPGGEFNLSSDSDGRWSVERYKGLLYQLERESNVIAKETRRGKGNFILCSSDVASALVAAGVLDYNPSMQTGLTVDDTGNTFAGVLMGRTRVYIDPYAGLDYINVGYRGSSPFDAGMFYCPYVPLTMLRAVDQNTFQPKIGFKTRYGLIANPFAEASPVDNAGTNRANTYYRIFKVRNLL